MKNFHNSNCNNKVKIIIIRDGNFCSVPDLLVFEASSKCVFVIVIQGAQFASNLKFSITRNVHGSNFSLRGFAQC